MKLSTDERKLVAGKWVESCGEDFKVIVHVGAECLETVIDLATHAADIGVDAIAVSPPSFYKPQGMDGVAKVNDTNVRVTRIVTRHQWLQHICDEVPSIPMYYYHIPERTGVNFPISEFLKKAVLAVPTLRGCKFASNDLADFVQAMHVLDGAFDMLWAKDEVRELQSGSFHSSNRCRFLITMCARCYWLQLQWAARPQ